MIKKFEKFKRELINKKWYSLSLLVIFLLTFLLLGTQAGIFVTTLLFVSIYKVREKVIFNLGAGCLILVILSMILKNYEIANIFAAFVFYTIIIIIVLRVNEYRQDPKSFIKPVVLKKREEKKLKNQLTQKVKEISQVKQNKTVLTLANIGIIIIYIILFGASLPNKTNFFRYLLLLVIIVLVNSVWPILKRLRKENNIDSESAVDIAKEKEKKFIVIINICLILIYLLISGFSWDIFIFSHLALFIFIMAIINFFAFTDLLND